MAIRVRQRRTHKAGSEYPPRDERHSKRRKQAVGVAPDVDVVSTSTAKVVLAGKKKRGDVQNVTPSIAPNIAIVVAPKPHSEVTHTPIIVQPMSPRRDRKWVRSVEELARGERWKRRLPEVCW